MMGMIFIKYYLVFINLIVVRYTCSVAELSPLKPGLLSYCLALQ